jgi:raffinose/stachyose/melibiose transport system substrate-binding protein
VQQLNPQLSLGWFFLPDEEGNLVIPENKDAYWCLTKECGEDEATYQAAVSFLNYFYRSDVYEALCEATYGIPIIKDRTDWVEDEIQLEIEDKFTSDHLHMSDYIGNADTPQGFEKIFLTRLLVLGQGEESVEETAAWLDEQWEALSRQEKQP